MNIRYTICTFELLRTKTAYTMISNKNKERARKFAQKIEGLSYDDAAKQIAKEVAKLHKEYKIATVRTVLTEYRKQAPKYKHLFVISDDDQQKIERKYTQKIAKQAKAQIEINDYPTMIATAVDLLSSARLVEVAVGLAFLTGRRISEILCTAKFADSNEPNKIHFVGQLKKRAENGRYKIYTLCEFPKISSALKFIRSKVGVISTTDANRKYIKGCNQVTYKHFSKHLGNCSTHDLRKAYATIIAHQYKPKSMTMNAFLSENLGHESTDLSTANVYQKYFI